MRLSKANKQLPVLTGAGVVYASAFFVMPAGRYWHTAALVDSRHGVSHEPSKFPESTLGKHIGVTNPI
jgi:hypothetical protein